MVATTTTDKPKKRPGDMDRTMALHVALAGAAGDVHAIAKDKDNDVDRYKFASAESVIIEVKPHLAKHGLALVPVGTKVKTVGSGCTLEATWILTHAEGGSLELVHEWPVIVEPGRPLDKAVAAARTACLGYLERDLLQLPRVEENTGLDDPQRSRARRGDRPAGTASTRERASGANNAASVRAAIGAQFNRLGFEADERERWAEVERLAGMKMPTLVALRRALDALKALPATATAPAAAAAAAE